MWSHTKLWCCYTSAQKLFIHLPRHPLDSTATTGSTGTRNDIVDTLSTICLQKLATRDRSILLIFHRRDIVIIFVEKQRNNTSLSSSFTANWQIRFRRSLYSSSSSRSVLALLPCIIYAHRTTGCCCLNSEEDAPVKIVSTTKAVIREYGHKSSRYECTYYMKIYDSQPPPQFIHKPVPFGICNL